MKLLVVGGTATVGSEATAETVRRDLEATIIMRIEGKAQSLPLGVSGTIGGLNPQETLGSAFAGATRGVCGTRRSVPNGWQRTLAVALKLIHERDLAATPEELAQCERVWRDVQHGDLKHRRMKLFRRRGIGLNPEQHSLRLLKLEFQF